MGLIDYFRETRTELREVNWPTRRQAVIYTVVVVALALGISLFLGLFDVLFQSLLKLVWQ